MTNMHMKPQYHTDIKVTIKEDIFFKGRVILTWCDATSMSAKLLSAGIRVASWLGWDRMSRRLIDLHHSWHMTRRMAFDNIVPTCGRQQIAKAVTGNLAAIADIEVNESALGTGTGAPANGDTTLGTETYRKAIASQSYSSNVAYNTAFYAAGDTNGTFYEHGIFIKGTGVADSGVLLSRVLLNSPSGIAKSAAETLTVEHQHTIS